MEEYDAVYRAQNTLMKYLLIVNIICAVLLFFFDREKILIWSFCANILTLFLIFILDISKDTVFSNMKYSKMASKIKNRM